jgi:YesN/AraC family two-component response regulator
MDRACILFVDDEPHNLTSFKAAFRRYYDIHLANSAAEAIQILAKEAVQVVITDQRMPSTTGVALLKKIIPTHPDTMRIILTGFSDVEAIIDAINQGQVYRYITKPWDKDSLKVTIDNALEAYHLRKENKALVQNLQQLNQALEEKVHARTQELKGAYEEMHAQNDFTKLLMHEMRHRVGNDLMAIYLKVNRVYETLTDPKSQQQLQTVRDYLAKLISVRNFLDYTPSLQAASENLPNNAIVGYFDEMAETLQSFYFEQSNQPHIELAIEVATLEKHRLTLIGFCAFELMTNACKYAFKDKDRQTLPAQITVTLHKQAQEIKLTVANNGISMPAELFGEHKQYLFDKTHRKGLKIIKGLVGLDQGHLQVYTAGVHPHLSVGTRFECIFKV